MKYWTELRTMMIVAKRGSVSAAALELGLHRATVTRHIELIESQLGTTLFIKHAKGVHLTDAGRDTLEIASRVEEQLSDLRGQSRNREAQLSGDLLITSLGGIAPLIMPTIKLYRDRFPRVLVSHLSGERPLRLEHGEAHIAIRAGAKPSEPDYVVRRFRPVRFGLYCHKNYQPNKIADTERLAGIELIGPTQPDLHQPFARWISALGFPPEFSIKVDSQDMVLPAILGELGAGYLADYQAALYPELRELFPPNDSTSFPLWTVVHHDLKRTTKVREFLELLYKSVA